MDLRRVGLSEGAGCVEEKAGLLLHEGEDDTVFVFEEDWVEEEEALGLRKFDAKDAGTWKFSKESKEIG